MLITNFIDPGELVAGELTLGLDSFNEARPEKNLVPWYRFRMIHTILSITMGNITLRLGDNEHIVKYAGHIGYNVDSQFRGHRYAARAVRMLLPHALLHGIEELWITCNPENIASRRTCEIAGGEMIEIVDIPPANPLYLAGERRKCRYRFYPGRD